MIREILLLGDERLYQKSVPVGDGEDITAIVRDLRDTLLEFRRVNLFGRAIAAPQIGELRRVLYMDIAGDSTVFINPEMIFDDDEMFEVLDDCMSFPGLLVRVLRHKRARIIYTGLDGQKHELKPEGDLSELLQHEYDHLDGILATMRAIDNRSFVMKRR